MLTGFGLCSKRHKPSHHQDQVVYAVVTMCMFSHATEYAWLLKMPLAVLPIRKKVYFLKINQIYDIYLWKQINTLNVGGR